MARRKSVSEVPVAETVNTQTLSVRLPTLELRRALTEKCDAEGIPVSKFVSDAVEAYIEGRLTIKEKQLPKPSYMVPADDA